MSTIFSKVLRTLALVSPLSFRSGMRKQAKISDMKSNIKLVNNNYKKVSKRIKQKLKNNEKIIVAFYVYEECRWKSQSVYDLFENDDRFIPYIFVSKNHAPETHADYMTIDNVISTYNFFKEKNMRVMLAYGLDNDDFIPFDKMSVVPDIVIYSHPWFVYKTQHPIEVSKYALAMYVPYSVSVSTHPNEYMLDILQYFKSYYVVNDEVKSRWSKEMINKGKNLKVVGHPMLDYFYLNKSKISSKNNCVIYAPHWSCSPICNVRWGTFLEIGEKLLEFAKKHPEIKWIYKPHPSLEGHLYINNFYTQQQYDKYVEEWKKIGEVMTSGDYLDLFMESSAMITECGSFEVEYFMTKKPVFHPVSKNNPMPYNPSVTRIVDSYYKSYNFEQLEQDLIDVILNYNDYKKEQREKLFDEFELDKVYCAKNILEDVLSCLK